MDFKNRIMLNFLYYYFKIFGNAPISIKFIILNQTNNSRWIFYHSKTGSLYNILLGVLLGIVSIFFYYYYDKQKDKMLDWFSTTGAVSTIGIVLIPLRFSIEPKDFLAVINKFEIQYLISEPSLVIIRNFQNIIGLSAIQLLKISYGCWADLSSGSSIFKVELSVFIDIWKKTITSSVLMQFSFILQLIEKSIKFMNSGMVDMLKLNNQNIYLIKLDKCMDLHSLLYDLSQKLFKYYSLSLFICIVYVFTSTLKHSYLILQYLTIADDFRTFDILQVFILTYPLLCVTRNVSAVFNEVCYFFNSFR